MKKVSDLIVDFLYKKGIRDAFLISGGGVIHLVDSIGKGKIRYICNHHEQACAIAAEGYARITNNPSLCIVTSGPGGTNTITGVMGAWLDSIPMIILSGQIRTETMGAGQAGLRQLGDQEINIIDIIKPITKYAAVVLDPLSIAYHLEKALYISTHGRPGPVWLDLPLNIQGAYVDEDKLKHFEKNGFEVSDAHELKKNVEHVIKKLHSSKRPVLLVGNGIRLANAEKELLKLVQILKIPVLTGFAGFDLISSFNPYSAGRPGTIGQRSANFTMQNSDLLLVVGSRLNVRMIGYNFDSFARAAYKIVVDIDEAELNKRTIKPDMKIKSDAKDFINEMIIQLAKKRLVTNEKDSAWNKKVKMWQDKYPTVLPEYWKQKKYVNPYCFIDSLSKHLKATDILVLADATASICTYQALKFPQGTRVITNSGCAAMGYGLSAAIGACFANKKKKIICLEGDGSIQLNLQELQTVVHHKLPIKLFIYINKSYASIRLSQKNLFEGRLVASGPESGVSCPDMAKIAKAYAIPSIKISHHAEMAKKIKKVLSSKGPIICEVMVSPDQEFLPKAASKKLPDGSFVSRPLEDMYPFLSDQELKENMLIPSWKNV